MSISSEITRIQNKRDLSFIEVENKGVTVPAGSTIDDLPGLIAQIEQGSGSGSGGIIYQDLDGYLNLSEDEANVISIVDTIDTAGGTVRTITGAVESGGLSWDNIAAQDVPNSDVTITGTSVESYAFYYRGIAENEWKFYGPNVTYIGQSALRNCPGLTEVHLPVLNSYHANGYAFYACAKLKTVDYGVMSPVRGNTFVNCTVFDTLILRKSDSIATLAYTTTFSGTPFASGKSGGTIYIPKALYDHLGDGSSLDYKSATNWSTVDGYGTITWAQIEGSIYETQFT